MRTLSPAKSVRPSRITGRFPSDSEGHLIVTLNCLKHRLLHKLIFTQLKVYKRKKPTHTDFFVPLYNSAVHCGHEAIKVSLNPEFNFFFRKSNKIKSLFQKVSTFETWRYCPSELCHNNVLVKYAGSML